MREQAANAEKEHRPFHKMQYWISLRSIPQDAIDAVIISEDGTFWSHHGFDWFEFKESVERNFEEGRAVRGASTITQQLVKNLYLSSSKNPLRKMKEWILTWYMEQQLNKTRILEIKMSLKVIGKRIPLSAKEYRKNLASRMKDFLKEKELDHERLTQEVALFVKSSDISEEVTRLKSHIEAMLNALKENGETGRKIDFIAQEMIREVNTIGSKSSDVTITNSVIELKSSIEKIREQAQNAE